MTELLVALAAVAFAFVSHVYGRVVGRRERGREWATRDLFALGRAQNRIRLLELHEKYTRADVQKVLRTWTVAVDTLVDDYSSDSVPATVTEFEAHLADIARDLGLDVDGDPVDGTADVHELTALEFVELSLATSTSLGRYRPDPPGRPV